MEALDGAEGDVVKALATLEQATGGGLVGLEQQVREGVKRGISGEKLGLIRWKLLGQVVSELPVALVGLAAVAVGLLALLISSSTVETEYSGTEAATDGGADPATSDSH